MRPIDDVLLLTPGPTPIHPRALAALHWPMRSHMDPDVFAFHDQVVTDLHELYRSGPGAFASLLSGTGSLGMEAGFANLLEPGDVVLIASNGLFGERMAQMAERQGARVERVCSEPGDPVDPERVRAAARRTPPKLIAVVHGETSTGVMNPVAELGRVAAEVGAMFSVDAVTTVGMLPFEMDAWGIDYAYTGSQKCLSAPPGVAPVVFSRRGLEAVAARTTPVATWYSDVLGMQRYWEPNERGRQYHHTVPVQLHWATGEAIRAALEEGIEARSRRVERVGGAALEALRTVGFAPAVPAAWRLPTVLAVTLPHGMDDARTRHALRFDHGVSVTGGLGPTSGKVWRLGLMGETAREEHYLRFLDALGKLLDAPHLADVFERSLAVA